MTTKHWTETSVEDFLYKIAADFMDQLQLAMNSKPMTRSQLAKRLGKTAGRVSQMFNSPGNLGLKQIITVSRALGLKVAIVAYDDNDPENERGPINSDIFRICWENAGQPNNFRHLSTATAVTTGLPADDLPPFVWAYNSNGRIISTGQTGAPSDATSDAILKEIKGARFVTGRDSPSTGSMQVPAGGKQNG